MQFGALLTMQRPCDFYGLAAAQEHADAQYNLGLMF
jgi:hypothetical protein